MPLYKYKVSDYSGKVFDEIIKGENQGDSLNKIRMQNLTPIKCYGEINSLNNKSHFKGFNIYEFTDRLVPLLEAHIPLEKAFSILSEGYEKQNDNLIIQEIRKGLHEGKPFSAIISEYKEFPPIYSNLLEAGEKSGALIEVIRELQRYLNEKKELNSFLITSSIYPGIILFVVSVVVIALFFFFIPNFAENIVDMGKELPFLTQIMLDTSAFFINFWWLWLLIIITVIYFISSIKKGTKAKDWFDKQILKVPFVGSMVESLEISKFIRTSAILVKNHIHLLETVKISLKVIKNKTVHKSLDGVSSELRNGAKLSEAFSKSSYIPNLALQMIKVGEESGNVGDMLLKVADNLEKKLRLKIERILSFFEPALILFMAGIVTIVVLSVFLAILEMNEI